MGEPLANPRVFDTLKLLTDSRAFGLSARRLNISTSGVLPGIKKLNEQHPQVSFMHIMSQVFRIPRLPPLVLTLRVVHIDPISVVRPHQNTAFL